MQSIVAKIMLFEK